MQKSYASNDLKADNICSSDRAPEPILSKAITKYGTWSYFSRGTEKMVEVLKKRSKVSYDVYAKCRGELYMRKYEVQNIAMILDINCKRNLMGNSDDLLWLGDLPYLDGT